MARGLVKLFCLLKRGRIHGMKELQRQLLELDRKGYKAYEKIKGTYYFHNFTFHVDHVQKDPYAPPSRVRIVYDRHTLDLDEEVDKTNARRIGTIDFFAYLVGTYLRKTGQNKQFIIDMPGQEILDRTAVVLKEKTLEVRLSIPLPAKGRTILGKKAMALLTKQLPTLAFEAIESYRKEDLEKQLLLVDEQVAIRSYLEKNECIAFIANGAILPRESGVSNRPLSKVKAIPFQSPPSFERDIPLPNGKTIRGMVLPKGIHLIVGGGYHGKSTLLQALERGVYNHRSEDGREYVITTEKAVKIRAEDGRKVTKVDISPFISQLPNKQDTTSFTTENASGSTSQAANIMESIEAGANCLLIDEDTSATNFMIRDARMDALVKKEPITPFIDQVEALYRDHGISTVLVIGGAGDYFDVADHVLLMDEYIPKDVTKEVKEIVASYPNKRTSRSETSFRTIGKRKIDPETFRFHGKQKIRTKGKNTILYGKEMIDLSSLEQLMDPSQTNAIAQMLRLIGKWSEELTMQEVLRKLTLFIEKEGIDALSPFEGHPGDMAMPRMLEVALSINRFRRLKIRD